MNEPILFLDDHRGIYIPRDFAQSIKHEAVTGVDEEAWAILEAGPDHEFYWDVWAEVCDDAKVLDTEKGITYTLWQDGPLWLIPEGYDNPEFFGM